MKIQKISALFLLIMFLNHTSYAAYTFEECGSIQKENLRDELNSIAQQSFSTELSAIDMERLISEKWADAGMDETLSREVDRAVERVKKDSGFWERTWSSWSAEKSKKFAEKVAGYAFSSEGFHSGLDKVSKETGEKLARHMETVSAKSASSAMLCLQEFIGKEYSESVSGVFEEELKKQTQEINWDEKIDPNQPSVTSMHKKALGGLGVIIAAQIGKKIAQKIGQSIAKRIAGRIASRIAGRIAGRAATSTIPIVGWIVGGGMIVWDLWDSRDGALPQIQKDLKGEEVSEKIQEEILYAVREQVSAEAPLMAREIADETFSLWSDFRNKYRQVMELAEELPEFKSVLNATSKQELYKLSNLVTLVSRKVGKEELTDSVKSGSFQEVMNLPEISFQIFEVTKSLKTLTEWAELAGRRIDRVVEFEVYKQKTPADFDKTLLERLLDVNDKNAINKLSMLEKTYMEAMLTVSGVNLKIISVTLTLEDMRCVSAYLPDADENSRNLIVSYAADSPSAIKRLCDESVKKEIMQHSNKAELISFLLAPNDYGSLLKDSPKMLDSSIPLNIFFHKYSVMQVILLTAALSVFGLVLFFLALQFVRRGRPQIIVNVPESRNGGGEKK